jgi:hypothetical protein
MTRYRKLSPQNEVQRSLQAQALKMSIDLGQTRWLLFEQRGSSIPTPFLVLLVFWVTIIFLSFGLFAPPNATVITCLFLCALSVSGAIFMILELDRSFGGLIQISSAPLQSASLNLASSISADRNCHQNCHPRVSPSDAFRRRSPSNSKKLKICGCGGRI